MKQTKCIFSKFGKLTAVMLVAVCTMFAYAMPTFAASSNGCDAVDSDGENKNDFINRRLALCSVHAYNIGATQNPDNYADRQTMNEVVALKTTIITQQMKKQYDYLETTIKRFKTQLEKAILTAKLEAAGAGTGDADKGKSGNVKLGESCMGKNRTDTVYCLRQNYAKMQAAVAAREFGNDLRQQIIADASAIYYMDNKLMVELNDKGEPTSTRYCSTSQDVNSQTKITDCMGRLNGAINKLEEGAKTNNGYMYQIPGLLGG
jgi:hypothetical protein